MTETHIDGNPLPLADWVVTGSPATVLDVGSTSSVNITNAPGLGAVRFTKTVTGAVTGEAYSFSFTANCGTAGSFDFVLPEADATPLVWDKTGLPSGTVCSITETSSTLAGAWSVTTANPAVTPPVAAGPTPVEAAMTNTRNTATLTLVKNVAGGNGTVTQWPLTATGPGTPAVSITGVSGTPAVTSQVVPTGTYSLSENGTVGTYTNGTTWNCPGKGTDLTSVTLASTENITCTITNTRKTGTLTLVKAVSDGVADPKLWTLTATGDSTTGTSTAANTVLSGAGGASSACPNRQL